MLSRLTRMPGVIVVNSCEEQLWWSAGAGSSETACSWLSGGLRID